MMMNLGSSFNQYDSSAAADFIAIPTVVKQRSDPIAFGSYGAHHFDREQEAEDFFLGSPHKHKR